MKSLGFDITTHHYIDTYFNRFNLDFQGHSIRNGRGTPTRTPFEYVSVYHWNTPHNSADGRYGHHSDCLHQQHSHDGQGQRQF